MMMPASAIRRDVYERLGGHPENLTSREDTHLFLSICLAGPVCALAGIAGEATATVGGLSGRERNTDSYWGCTRWLYSDLLRRHPDLAASDRAVLRRRAAEASWRLARSTSAATAVLCGPPRDRFTR